MAKAEANAAEVHEFPVTLAEFLSEIPNSQPEKKGGFQHLCKTEGITGHKTRSEWNDLLDKYGKKPVGTPWCDWVKQGGK